MTGSRCLIVLGVSALAGFAAVIEDFTTRRTSAVLPQDPGEFTPDGWRVTTERCQMKWDLGRHYPRGTVEFDVKGPLKQQAKRILFSAWNEEAGADGDRKTQSFFQLRVMQDGMMLRLSHRPGGRSFEGFTGGLDWDGNRWYHIKGQWDTEGGLNHLWRDGDLIATGHFNQPHEGFRWIFIGKDNYQNFLSIPGTVYRNLKVTVQGPTQEPPLDLYFPPPGEGLDVQSRVTPEEAGFDPRVIAALEGVAPRWALWRNGRLVHVKGDFNQTSNVASHRKTWHALTVGAAIQLGKIQSLNQPISEWNKDLAGEHANATWWHVITQSAGFDYPYGEHPAYPPGRMWTYSDYNPVNLCNALARVWGRKDYHDQYEIVVKEAFVDAIGMRGWNIAYTKDPALHRADDGVRFVLDLEDMGRLGLLVLARGNWNGKQLVPAWFVRQLERKQTYGMLANYDGPNDGKIGLDPNKFPECPYGFMTWVNTDGDQIPGADRGWAYASGARGHVTLWNRRFGIVFAAAGAQDRTLAATVLEKHLCDDKPSPQVNVGRWDRFEITVGNERSYADPYNDVTLNVTYTAPDGERIDFWGFHDGGSTWKLRFMPDRFGEWRYEAAFSDGAPGASGTFRVVESGIPGLIGVDEYNPMWFGYKGGRHLLIRSFHVGDRFFAANWAGEKRTAFLDWLGAQRYNMLSIASHYLNRDVEGRGRGWDTPKLWPLDAAEYRRMEAILDDLARRKIFVFPFAGFFGKESDYPRDPAGQERYVRYTLARLAPYWNLLLNVAGPEPNLRDHWMESKDVERLGRLIKRLDPFGHVVSVHNRTGDDPYIASDWTDFGVTQGPKTVNRSRLALAHLANHHLAKPLYAQETLWPGNILHKEPYANVDIRKNAFVMLMSAAAINFGDMNGLSSSGFTGTMDLADRFQERHDIIGKVWDFFESVPFWRMTPRPELVDNGYCLAEVGRRYLVYLESRGTVNVRVAGGPYSVRWINAQDTSDVRSGGSTEDGRNLASPADGDDWLLDLTRETPGMEIATGRMLGQGYDTRSFYVRRRGGPWRKTYSDPQHRPEAAGRLMNLRIAQGLFHDEWMTEVPFDPEVNTNRLIEALDTYKDHGILAISVSLQGGNRLRAPPSRQPRPAEQAWTRERRPHQRLPSRRRPERRLDGPASPPGARTWPQGHVPQPDLLLPAPGRSPLRPRRHRCRRP